MKFILPRVIYGNRGDLASRWGILHTLNQLDINDVEVFYQYETDVPDLGYKLMKYGKLRNLIPNWSALKTYKKADVVLWAVGLDMQDDSSLAKLIYLWLIFHLYRLFGLKIWCVFQGAGPITTKKGKRIAASVLSCVDVFITRDPETLKLLNSLSQKPTYFLGYDAIFLPGFEQIEDYRFQLTQLIGEEKNTKIPLVGINIRQWFHFTSSILPYEFAKDKYQKRSEEKMAELQKIFRQLIDHLTKKYNAKILLLSAYQPGVVPWEDDLPWLKKLKNDFENNPNVVLVDSKLSIPQYFQVIKNLDLMIGMRLHSSLIALRFGIPSINVSYTLKGHDIFNYLGFSENVLDLEEVLSDGAKIIDLADKVIQNLEFEQKKVLEEVKRIVIKNRDLFSSIIEQSFFVTENDN